MPAYRDKDGQWCYRFRRRGRRYGGSSPVHVNTKSAALAAEQAHIARLANRDSSHAGGVPTVRDFAGTMLKHLRQRLKPLTYETTETILRVHIIPEIGDEPIDEIGTRVLSELAELWLERGATPRTANTRLSTVARMLSLAVEMEIIIGAPKPRYLRVPRRFPRFLSDAEAELLLDAAPDEWRSMILVGLRTGLRIGELRGLQWGDVDFLRGVIIIRRTDPGRRDMPQTTPKGGAERLIALSPEALATLRNLRALTSVTEPSSLIWPSTGRGAAGRSRHLRTCWSAMRRAATRAKLTRVSWHTLRHTCASWLVMRGVSLRIVQAILGHASIRQTEIYAHLAPDVAFHGAMALLDTPLAPWAPPIKALPAGTQHGDQAIS